MHLPPDAGKGHPKPPLHDSGLMIIEGGTDDGASEKCAPRAVQTVTEPVGLYLMVEQSSAMQLYWDDLSMGLQDFINESNRFVQISIGCQFYPATPVGLFNIVTYPLAMCAETTYASADVTIAPISDTQLALINSVSVHGPAELSSVIGAQYAAESPADMAVAGGIDLAQVWARNHGVEHPHAALVLITAGIPGPDVSPTCRPSASSAVALAETGLSGTSITPSVRTFVLGISSANPDLDAIARAGDTDRAHYAVLAADIARELRAIRRAALPCDIELDTTEVKDAGLALQYVAASGTSERYARVASATACDAGATVGQWFQGPGEETTAHLCPVTCEAARTHAGGRIDVIRSCPPPSVP